MINILMSARNAEKYIGESIKSILAQTERDFVFYIIDDASTDQTAGIIKGFRDSRIVFFQNEKQIGLTKNLNFLLTKCRGEFIARQDADDVSHIDRLVKQKAYQEKHGLDLVACHADLIDEDGKIIGGREYHGHDIKTDLLKNNIFIHGSWFGRRSFFDMGYDEKYQYAQDYDLLLRAVSRVRLGILPEKLIDLRISRSSISLKHLKKQHYFGLRARLAAIKRKTYPGSAIRCLIRPFVSYLAPAAINKIIYKITYGY